MGSSASGAELQKIIAVSEPLAAKADLLICPPATLVRIVCDARARLGGGDRRTGLPHGGLRRAYRRYFSRNVEGCGGLVRHRRAFGAAGRPWRDGFARECKSRGGVAGRAYGHPLRRRNARERDSGKALEVVGRQLAASVPDGATAENLVIAYEPVWAIGTGLTPTVKDVEQVHGFHSRKIDRGVLPGGRRGHPHPVWRIGQAVECGGTAGGQERQRCADRRGQSESVRFPCDSRRRVPKSRRDAAGWQSSLRSCRDPANSNLRAVEAQPLRAAATRPCAGKDRCKPSLSSFIS